MSADIYDTIVVGAGPAGLTAAIYLGRFRRRCLVLEDGHSRARWIPTSHNIPGFVAGIGGTTFLATLRQQAAQFGARIHRTHVSGLRQEQETFCLQTDSGTFSSRYLILATGVRDHIPAIDGATGAVTRSILRICPICDAFEAIDKRIAVIGNGPLGEREAWFLSHYSSQVTLLQLPSSDPTTADATTSRGIERIFIAQSDLELKEDRVRVSRVGVERDFDVAYLALGCSPQYSLARTLGADCDETGALTVNRHQETSVAGLYAAGDVVRGLNQVVIASAESAIAATDIHNKLRAE